MSIFEDLEDLEMTDAGDAEAPATGDQPPPPKTIFDLLNARRWDEARGWIDYRPECVYDQNEAQHRTPLHVICCMKFDDDGDNDDRGDDGAATGSGQFGSSAPSATWFIVTAPRLLFSPLNKRLIEKAASNCLVERRRNALLRDMVS